MTMAALLWPQTERCRSLRANGRGLGSEDEVEFRYLNARLCSIWPHRRTSRANGSDSRSDAGDSESGVRCQRRSQDHRFINILSERLRFSGWEMEAAQSAAEQAAGWVH